MVKFENYLTDVTNRKHRVAMSKLRTSDHKLMIEQGRRKGPRIERSFRTCPRCECCIEMSVIFQLPVPYILAGIYTVDISI